MTKGGEGPENKATMTPLHQNTLSVVASYPPHGLSLAMLLQAEEGLVTLLSASNKRWGRMPKYKASLQSAVIVLGEYLS